MTHLAPDDLVEQFHDRTLPKAAWTHEAHLIVCWYALRTMTIDAAAAELRHAIRAYNETTGTPNTETSGYHETLTRYYVSAVAALNATTVEATFDANSCSRTAPSAHWTRERLFTPEARARWLEPDLRPLPWPTHDTSAQS